MRTLKLKPYARTAQLSSSLDVYISESTMIEHSTDLIVKRAGSGFSNTRSRLGQNIAAPCTIIYVVASNLTRCGKLESRELQSESREGQGRSNRVTERISTASRRLEEANNIVWRLIAVWTLVSV
jgi:hypothetical protein